MPLFAALEAACKGISMLVQRAAIAGATGAATGGGQNAGGDQQKKLDVVSNDLLKGFLARSGVVRVLASEEVSWFCETLSAACVWVYLHTKFRTFTFRDCKLLSRGPEPPDRAPKCIALASGIIFHFGVQPRLGRNASHIKGSILLTKQVVPLVYGRGRLASVKRRGLPICEGGWLLPGSTKDKQKNRCAMSAPTTAAAGVPDGAASECCCFVLGTCCACFPRSKRARRTP